MDPGIWTVNQAENRLELGHLKSTTGHHSKSRWFWRTSPYSTTSARESGFPYYMPRIPIAESFYSNYRHIKGFPVIRHIGNDLLIHPFRYKQSDQAAKSNHVGLISACRGATRARRQSIPQDYQTPYPSNHCPVRQALASGSSR